MLVLRKLVFAFGVLGLLIAQQAGALGLGPAELKSALNQPLKADIQITNLGDLEEGDIVVTLSSLNDFEKAGIAFLPFYNQLRFELMLNQPEGPMVRVTTREPVQEPYLNFLVEARWATGRLLREYTFLLDLPTFDQDRAQQPVEAASGQRRTEQPSPRVPSARATPSPRQQQERSPVSPTGADSDVYGPVGANDTLWEIAVRARPGSDLSVQQTMLAIQRKNPEAFINGNINLLRRGQVLRLPNRDEIQTVSQAQAVSRVAEQNRDWSQGARGAQLDAGRRDATPRRESGEVAGQVSLATPPRASEGEAGQGGGASDARGEELERELSTTLEELDKTRRENRELSSRVEELEAQIDTMESLIEASNEQLRALQLASEQNRAQSADQEAVAEQTETAPQTETVTEEVQTPTQPQAESVEDAQRDPSRVVRSAPEAPSFIEQLMNNVVAVGVVLLALILLAGLLFWRRRQNQAADVDDPDQNYAEDDLEPLEEQDGQIQEGQGERYDLADDEDRDYENFDTLSDEETETAESETGDVVGEADIYIAYGKLDQAEEMLLKGLAKEPNSAPILGKLLEVYAERQDVERFDTHYATLLNTGDRAAIQRAGDLRDSIPGAGEFDVSAFAVAPGAQKEQGFKSVETENFEGEELDFSHLSDDLDPEASTEEQDFGDLDFELDEELSVETSSKPSEDQKLALDDEFSFDLDDSDELDGTPAQDDNRYREAGQSRYDLSFEEETSEPKEDADSEFTLDFGLDEELELDEEPKPADSEQAETLTLEDEEEAPTLELDSEDDFNFDLETTDASELNALDDDLSALDDELETDSSTSDQPLSLQETEPEAADEPTAKERVESEPSPEETEQEEEFSFDLEETSEEKNETSLESDDEADFDPNLEVGDFDLAALDEEMGNLDEDVSSEEPSKLSSDDLEPEAPLEDQPETAVSFEEDDMFDEALSDFADDEQELEIESPAEDRKSEVKSEQEPASEEELDAELDFLADADEAATKLDLARAYIDMGDSDGAKEILSEVSQEGNEEQRREAEELLERL